MCLLNIGIVEGLKYLCVSVQILKVYANFMKYRLFITVYSLSRLKFSGISDLSSTARDKELTMEKRFSTLINRNFQSTCSGCSNICKG